MLASGLGAAITDTIFNPLEMLKVRVQTSDTTFQAAARAVYAGRAMATVDSRTAGDVGPLLLRDGIASRPVRTCQACRQR